MTYPLHIILAVIITFLYFFNNYYLKQNTAGFFHWICTCYFDDFMGGTLFLAYTNVFLATQGKLISKLWMCLGYMFLVGLFWEYWTPLVKKDSVSDVGDLISYLFGAVLYWGLLKLQIHFLSKKVGSMHD